MNEWMNERMNGLARLTWFLLFLWLQRGDHSGEDHQNGHHDGRKGDLGDFRLVPDEFLEGFRDRTLISSIVGVQYGRVQKVVDLVQQRDLYVVVVVVTRRLGIVLVFPIDRRGAKH